jgi:hypothetical protein
MTKEIFYLFYQLVSKRLESTRLAKVQIHGLWELG